MPPVISAISNAPADGQNLQVTLATGATGALSFHAHRYPGEAPFACAYTGVGPYDVQVRPDGDGAGEGSTPVRVPFFVTATDDTGTSSAASGWCCAGTDRSRRLQLEDALIALLAAYAPHLDAAMQIYLRSAQWPNQRAVKVQKILRGIPAEESQGKYPLVSVRIHSWSEDLYWGENYSDLQSISGSLYCYLIHQTEIQHESLVGELANGVCDVLNQVGYLNIQLPCGLYVQEAHCQTARTEETAISLSSGQDAYLASAEISYLAKLPIGKVS